MTNFFANLLKDKKKLIFIVVGAIVALLVAIIVVVAIVVPKKTAPVISAPGPTPTPAPVISTPTPTPVPAPVPATPTPGPVVAPPAPAPVVSKWEPIKKKYVGESSSQYSARIYDLMVGDAMGTRQAPYEGGVSWNATQVLGDSQGIDAVIATALCDSPCYWYYNQGTDATRAKMDSAGLCQCTGTLAAIGF